MTLIADIEKAFLMVSGLPEDRDVLRFLCLDTSSDKAEGNHEDGRFQLA